MVEVASLEQLASCDGVRAVGRVEDVKVRVDAELEDDVAVVVVQLDEHLETEDLRIRRSGVRVKVSSSHAFSVIGWPLDQLDAVTVGVDNPGRSKVA